MAVQVSYPGVYIEEFTPGAPIQGVGTSTAAFIGPGAQGELDEPTKITSWDQFLATFGTQPLPGFFLWYAVRGFFENGGQVCYVVRASNGTYAEVMLNNRAGVNLVRVRARQPGAPNPQVVVAVTEAHLLASASTALYQPSGTFAFAAGSPREITVANVAEAAQFRPGDQLDIGGEQAQLVRVSGITLRLATDLPTTLASPGTVRLADASAGTQTIRIKSTVPVPAGALVPGTMLTITQSGNSESQIVTSVQPEPLQTNPPITTYRITFRQGLNLALSLDQANPATVESEEFTIVITQGVASTSYANLSVDPAHPRYFLPTINNNDTLVRLELIEPPPTALPPQNLPDIGTVTLTGGQNENLATLSAGDYIDALDTLSEIDDVNIIAVPGSAEVAVQQAVIAHCEELADRFAVVDAQPGLGLFGNNSVEEQRRSLNSTRGYGALYYPWLRVLPVGPGSPILVPPSGHVCGIMARSDNSRGVHKAPANEIINGALGVERTMDDIDQGQLNLQGINIIRLFQTGGRPVLWGARTTATDTNWQYVNIRRLFLFLEESIEEGIRWAVFEPNNLQLWQKLKRTITEFLTRAWRDGALFGEAPEQAFYVRIDETLNPFSEQAMGRLNIEIGVRPSYPAEFIIVRIGISPDTTDIAEI